ncbi:ABC transporter substrate-binding protein [Halostagnicola sp. A-GB9-2]|uniref:ABC transporter substrate-binding protein n=1 Tax=Halostagnicola sp. A-GB9-2 TaxID=3048066 RepID=UPI0024BF2F2C|nr:ABC transporter substrate-binding protein [Halostagnicola sp. A-GB9-2]MDJ1433837.1 ABC transporter substrate-binding protein [Halostagnicola sp. A-GB9-2]
MAGCLGGNDGDDETIHIGSLHALAPPVTEIAETEQEAVTAVIDRINDDGGIDGRPVEVQFGSTDYDAATAAQEATRLVESEGVDVLYGGFGSPDVHAVADYVRNRDDIPYLVPAGFASLSREDCHRSTFTLDGDESMASRLVLPEIQGRSGTSGWLHIIDHDWGSQIEDHFTNVLEEEYDDLEIIETTRTAPAAGDFSTAITEMMNADPDWCYFGGGGIDFIEFVNQGQQNDLQEAVDLYAPHLEIQDLAGAGSNAEGIVGGIPYSPTVDTELNQEFIETFQMEGDGLPNSISHTARNALYLYKEAVESAGTTEYESVIEALETSEIETPMGSLHIRECDHRAMSDLHVGEAVVTDQFEIPIPEPFGSEDGESLADSCEDVGCEL